MSENLHHPEPGGPRAPIGESGSGSGAAGADSAASAARRWGRAALSPRAPIDHRRPHESAAQSQAIFPKVEGETGRLRSVIIGYPDMFELPAPINRKQEIFHDRADRPTAEALIPEFAAFRAALESHGVTVHQPQPVPGVPDQLTPRDIGFVIGETFVIARMAAASRRDEWIGIRHFLDRMPESSILRAPGDVVIEGGDVILDRGVLFVGVGQRTDEHGAAFLQERFGSEYEVIPVLLKPLDDDEDILHLDCAFVPVGERHALIYPDGLSRIPPIIRERYEWIEVDREEQFELATNVLSISRNALISRTVCPRVNAELRDCGFEVFEVAFDGTPKSGGSFRCASLPLVREE